MKGSIDCRYIGEVIHKSTINDPNSKQQESSTTQLKQVRYISRREDTFQGEAGAGGGDVGVVGGVRVDEGT